MSYSRLRFDRQGIAEMAEKNEGQESKWPIPDETCEIIICIGKDLEGIIVAGTDKIWETLDGIYCSDNFIENVPKEVGVYKCQCQFWFQQGCCDGYPAPGESDWGWKVIQANKLCEIPKYEKTEAEKA